MYTFLILNLNQISSLLCFVYSLKKFRQQDELVKWIWFQSEIGNRVNLTMKILILSYGYYEDSYAMKTAVWMKADLISLKLLLLLFVILDM